MTAHDSQLPDELFTPLDEVRAEGTAGCEAVATTCTDREAESNRLREQQESVVGRHEAIMDQLHDGVFRKEVSELIVEHREEEAALLADLIEPLVRRRLATLGRCSRGEAWRIATLAGPDAFILAVGAAAQLHGEQVKREQALLKRQRSLEGIVRSFDTWAKGLAD